MWRITSLPWICKAILTLGVQSLSCLTVTWRLSDSTPLIIGLEKPSSIFWGQSYIFKRILYVVQFVLTATRGAETRSGVLLYFLE